MNFSRIIKIFHALSPLQRSLISAISAFFFYGGWAVFVNFSHGMMAAMKAGLVQGSYSFILTLCMTMLLELVFKISNRVFSKDHLINWFTIFICCSAVFSISWGVNAAAGTPEILRTVILGYVIGGIYIVLYVHGLAREDEL